MKIKITTLNEDGSIAFEGEFTQNEASLILEVGTNFLLQQGVLPFTDPDEEDEAFEVEGPDTVQ
jgi:hypothetical protein